jgi:hypothetical protein
MKRLIYEDKNEDENEDQNEIKRQKFMSNKSDNESYNESDYPDTIIDSDIDLDLNSLYFCSRCLCEYKNTNDCNCRCHIKHELKNDDLRNILNKIQTKKTFFYEDEDKHADNLIETEHEPQGDNQNLSDGSSYDIYSEDADNENTDTDTDTDTDHLS